MDRAAAVSAPPSLPSGGAGKLTAPATSPAAWLIGMLALCALVFIAGGPIVIAVPVLGYLAYRWPNRYGVLAFAAVIVSGVVAAVAAHPAAPGSGPFSGIAQACALIALAAALVPARPGRGREA